MSRNYVEFEFNKWYKRIEPEYSKILIFVYDYGYYGFDSDGKWFNSSYFDYNESYKERLIPATIKEVKERLLSYAKEKYPIGTKFTSLTGRSIHTVDEYNINFSKEIRTITDSYSTIFRKDTGEWADVISLPNKKDNEKPLKPYTGKFKVGDKVKVVRKAANYEGDWENHWYNLMDFSVGKELFIKDIFGKQGYCLNDGFRYPEFVLEKIEEVKQPFVEKESTIDTELEVWLEKNKGFIIECYKLSKKLISLNDEGIIEFKPINVKYSKTKLVNND